MQIRYIGRYDFAEIPALGIIVKRGETFDVAHEHTVLTMCEQTENYEPVDPAELLALRMAWQPAPAPEVQLDESDADTNPLDESDDTGDDHL